MKIELIPIKRKTKDGRVFTKFVTIDEKGNYYDVAFPTSCENKPTKHCIANVYKENVNLSNKKNSAGACVKNKAGENIKVLWINAIDSFEKDETVKKIEEERRAKAEAELLSLFK